MQEPATPELKCSGTTLDGAPCGAPPVLVDPSTGLCRNHDPDLKEARREDGRKGAKAAARNRKRREPGLDSDELGKLETIEDQQRWLRLVAQAIAERRLTHQEGAVISRLLSEWVKSEDVRLRAVDLRKLQQQVDGLRKGRAK